MTLRRELLGLAVGTVAARIVLPLAASAETLHPDADLINLGVLFRAARPAERAAWERAGIEADDGGPLTKRANALSAEIGVVVDQIAQLRATTLPGLLVKMVALDWLSCGEPVSADIFNHPFKGPLADDDSLILSVLGDLEALAGTGAG